MAQVFKALMKADALDYGEAAALRTKRGARADNGAELGGEEVVFQREDSVTETLISKSQSVSILKQAEALSPDDDANTPAWAANASASAAGGKGTTAGALSAVSPSVTNLLIKGWAHARTQGPHPAPEICPTKALCQHVVNCVAH